MESDQGNINCKLWENEFVKKRYRSNADSDRAYNGLKKGRHGYVLSFLMLFFFANVFVLQKRFYQGVGRRQKPSEKHRFECSNLLILMIKRAVHHSHRPLMKSHNFGLNLGLSGLENGSYKPTASSMPLITLFIHRMNNLTEKR